MIRHAIALAAFLIAAPASAMTAAAFLQKAEALQAKGAMALFSGDLKLLKAEVVNAAAQLRAERIAASQAGRKPAYCPPKSGTAMNSDQIVAVLRAVPAAERPRVQVKDALRTHFARTYPCG